MIITDTAQTVLKKRYYLKGETGWHDVCKRNSVCFGKTDAEIDSFYSIMMDGDFLPNTPALMNAGTEIKAYSACYVLPIEDNIESIFKYYSDAGKISKSGGGVGASFDNIRGMNKKVQSTNGVASGPVSFMEGQDALTDVIKQGGRRRGANMGILMCDHPDIWDFIRVKDDPTKLTNFNLSVGITDEFMDYVTETIPTPDDTRADYDRDMWQELAYRAWNKAEPGVLFMDTIERGNTVPHLGKLEATNPLT